MFSWTPNVSHGRIMLIQILFILPRSCIFETPAKFFVHVMPHTPRPGELSRRQVMGGGILLSGNIKSWSRVSLARMEPLATQDVEILNCQTARYQAQTHYSILVHRSAGIHFFASCSRATPPSNKGFTIHAFTSVVFVAECMPARTARASQSGTTLNNDPMTCFSGI